LSKSADLQRKPLDPGLRRDDDFECISFYNVIPIFESTTFEPAAFEASSRRRPGSSVVALPTAHSLAAPDIKNSPKTIPSSVPTALSPIHHDA
jgi:hypothetical protein